MIKVVRNAPIYFALLAKIHKKYAKHANLAIILMKIMNAKNAIKPARSVLIMKKETNIA